jgi:hypothetical protein
MKYEAHTLGEMLRKVAIDYVRFGYYRYVVRQIPKEKDPKPVDEKILKSYSITYHRTTRARLRQQGQAAIAYVRWGHRFVLLATEGHHAEVEKRSFLDCRTQPILLRGYTIGVRNGKPSVEIAPKRFRALKKLLYAIALHNEAKLTDFFERISPFHFPGVVRQKRKLLNMVNKRRKKAGLGAIAVTLYKHGHAPLNH